MIGHKWRLVSDNECEMHRNVTSSIRTSCTSKTVYSVIMITTLLVSPIVKNQTHMTMTAKCATLNVGHAVAQTISSVTHVMILIITSRTEPQRVQRHAEMANCWVIISVMMVTLRIMTDVHMIVTMNQDSIACQAHRSVLQCALRCVVMDDTSTMVVMMAMSSMVMGVTLNVRLSMATHVMVVDGT